MILRWATAGVVVAVALTLIFSPTSTDVAPGSGRSSR